MGFDTDPPSPHQLRTPRRLGAPQQPAPHRLLDQRSPEEVTTAPTAPGGDALHRSHPAAAPDAEGLRRGKPPAASGRRPDDQPGNVFLRRTVAPEEERPPQVPGEAPPGGAPAAPGSAIPHAEGDAAGDAPPLQPAANPPPLRRCAKGVGHDGRRVHLPDRFSLFFSLPRGQKHSAPHRWPQPPAATSCNGDFQRERDVFCKSGLDRRTCFDDSAGRSMFFSALEPGGQVTAAPASTRPGLTGQSPTQGVGQGKTKSQPARRCPRQGTRAAGIRAAA